MSTPRRRIPHSRRARKLTGVLPVLTLLLVGGAVQIATASPGRAHPLAAKGHARRSHARGAEPAVRPYVPVQVLVADGAKPLPLVGARVRVWQIRAGHGHPIAVGHTYSRGLALVEALPGHTIPREFLVQVTGGFINGARFGGTLYAREDAYHQGQPRSVIVNLPTTLAAMYCRRHPRLTTPACEQRTSAFLDLNRFGAGGDLSTHLVGDLALDGRKLLHAAARSGGLGRYLAKLVTGMSGPHPRPAKMFHDSLQSTEALAPSPSSHSSPKHGARGARAHIASPRAHTASLIGFLTESPELFKKIAKYGEVLRGGVSFVKGITEFINLVNGTSRKTQEDLNEIKRSLSQMEASLAVIHEQLKTLEESVVSLGSEAKHSEYSAYALAVVNDVNAVYNNLSPFEAVVKQAAQITCGDYAPGANLEKASCADPRSPGERCTMQAEEHNEELRSACVHLGDLPIVERQHFYSEEAPQAARESLIGDFINHLTKEDGLNDSDVETIADAAAGGPSVGGGESEGIWQADSAWLVKQHRFLGRTVDRKLQKVVHFYLFAYITGMVMRGYYYSFEQLPETTSASAEARLLEDLRDLEAAAPSPLPRGTFIDTDTGLMWSGQLGSVASQSTYSGLVNAGPAISLPYQPNEQGNEPNAAPGAPTPTLANREVIKNWAAAGNEQLEKLMKGANLTDLVSEKLFAGQIVSNSSSGWIHAQWPSGVNVTLSHEEGDTLAGFYPCQGLESSGGECLAPVWAAGESLGMFDLHSGEGVSAHVHLSGTNNWWGSLAMYTGTEPNEAEEDTPFIVPAFIGTVQLPVLYYREPPTTGSAAECYYYSGGDGCKA